MHYRHLPLPRIFLPLEAESQIPILIDDIIDMLNVRMFCHDGEDAVAGRPQYIGVPEGGMPHLPMPLLPIPLIPHLTDNESDIVGVAECLSGPTPGVGLPHLPVKVQEPEDLYLVQYKVDACHGENRPSRIDILLLLCILPVF